MDEENRLEDRRLEGILREVIDALARFDRTPCSPGERRAAEWLAERLRAVPGVDVALEDEPSWGTFPPTATALGLAGVAGAALTLRGRRAVGALLAAAGLVGLIDEILNGPRVLRRLLRRRRGTVNVVARAGDRQGRGTLVVSTHHDAPQTGLLFDQTLQRRFHELAPEVLERFKTPPPQWWIGIAAPLATLAGAALGLRSLSRAGLVINALGTAIVADIWRSPTVPGANDNLSGVAALVALAELMRERPPAGLHVMLVSCGAEETLQDGIRAFMARHREELAVGQTWFVNLEAVGSPHLVMLEAEGPVWMERYAGPWLRDLLAARAERLGIALHRGYRARASTDGVIPSRAGYPIATLVSMTDWRTIANYHLRSDVPDNLDYSTVSLRPALWETWHGRWPRSLSRAIPARSRARPGQEGRPTRRRSEPEPGGIPAYTSPASLLPAATSARAVRAWRMTCRSSMRASKGSSAFSAVTAYAGTPAWRAREAISNVLLPSSARSSSRLTATITARARRMRVSKSRARSSSARAPGPSRSSTIGQRSGSGMPPACSPLPIAEATRSALRGASNALGASSIARGITIGHPFKQWLPEGVSTSSWRSVDVSCA
jgi:hypothetical protein